MTELYEASAAPSQHYPRRILVLAAAFAVAGILAAAGYAGFKLTHAATPVATIGCYETDSLNANTSVLASGTQSPVAACSAIYASAFPGSQRPPSFAACVLPSGSIGVFPSDAGSDTCKRLGLSDGAKAPGVQQQTK